MALFEASYPIAPRGRATSFTESELPIDYALEMKNRFINAAGGAEKRQGMTQMGGTIDGTPNLQNLHALIASDGTETILVSGAGRIWRFDDPTFTLVHSGLDGSVELHSVQMEDKLIFVNGVDRNIFTEDGTNFEELVAIVERGEADTGTNSTTLVEADITNWISDTDLAVNDLLFNRTNNAYAMVSTIAASAVSHTAIGVGVASAIGVSTAAQASGDRYELIDLVELNVVPTDGEPDNVATTDNATDDNIIQVSAVSDWTATEIKVGDWVRNTTRTATARITLVSAAAIHVTGVSAQTAGDSIILMKSAMPVAARHHVHFGRLYMIDARDERLIRISGPNNPENMTTQAGTIDSSTFKYGSTQPVGDAVVALSSFQRFFSMAGRKNHYFFEGVDPIADTTADTTNFDIIGLFPQGVVSHDGLTSIGNDMIWVTPDGVQSASLVGDASTLGRANLSEAIKTTLRDELKNTPEAQIKAFHYPRRSWYMLKVGSQMHIFNYTAYFGQDQLSSRAAGTLSTQAGSWSLFDGKFARQNDYFVRQDGSLICCGPGGKVYTADDGSFTDDNEEYSTEYKTGWLTLEPNERRSVLTKQGNYIKPVFETGDTVNYSVLAEAGFDSESTETITIPASGGAAPIGLAVIGQSKIGGSSTQNVKYSLRWRGEQVRLTFTTNDTKGPDTISRVTLYATKWGRR